MSLEQIEYVDKILPFFGCKDITDDKSLFNKSTITDWEKLKQKLNNDMENMKTIFPTKTLNLKRLNGTITTQQQALALLRGLLKLIGVGYTIVRSSTAEFMRLSFDKKNLVYYIIHKNMQSTHVKQVPIRKEFPDECLKMTKKFYAKFSTSQDIKECDALPEKHKFLLVIGEQPILRTTTLIFDESKDMWEIKFCKEILVLHDDIPIEYSDALLLNLLSCHKVIMYTKAKCQVFIEYYENLPINPKSCINTYIEYVDNYYGLTTNLLSICCGMAGMKIAPRMNYRDEEETPYDPITDFKRFVDENIAEKIFKRRVLCNPLCLDKITFPSRILIIGRRACGKTHLCKKILKIINSPNTCICVNHDVIHEEYNEYKNILTYDKKQPNVCINKDNFVYVFDDCLNMKQICQSLSVANPTNTTVIVIVQCISQISSQYDKLFDIVFVPNDIVNDDIVNDDIVNVNVNERTKLNKRFKNIKYFTRD
jgi:hypothetical protein